MVVVQWALVISLFWMISALFLGGAPIRIEGGGGVRQSTGLLVSFAAFLALWYGLKALLAGATSPVAAFLLATGISGLLVPPLSVGVFRVLGVRIRKSSGEGH